MKISIFKDKLFKKTPIVLVVMLVTIIFTGMVLAEGVPVNVVEVENMDISETEIINAALTPYKSVRISSKTGGVIEKINVEVGQRVNTGEELVVFENKQIMQQLKQAEAALEIAQANYEMLQKGATIEDLNTAEASYRQAAASVEGARKTVKLLETMYNDRTAPKQQLISAETQVLASEKQLEAAQEGKRQAETGVKQAQTGLEQVRKEYDRVKHLFEEGAATQSEMDMIETQLENAEASLENARSAVANAEIAFLQAEISLESAEQGYELARDSHDDPLQLEQQLENARTQLEIAEANQKVAEANWDKAKKGARDEEKIIAQANVKQAEAALEQARLSFEDTVIKSPIEGIVAGVTFEEEELAPAGNPIVSIVDIDNMYIEAGVSAGTVVSLNVGDRTQARILPYDNLSKEGEIENISPVADPQTGAYQIKVLIENDDGRLKGGMFVDLELVTDSAKNTDVVPVETILNLDDAPYLFVVEEGRAARIDVDTGIITKDYVQIISGVKAGQKVVISGHHNLGDGDRVEVVD